ncbi:hypothetical protein VUR80DRAFT_3069 [Thermomyces stellatus]
MRGLVPPFEFGLFWAFEDTMALEFWGHLAPSFIKALDVVSVVLPRTSSTDGLYHVIEPCRKIRLSIRGRGPVPC